jgi:hypothetical protein
MKNTAITYWLDYLAYLLLAAPAPVTAAMQNTVANEKHGHYLLNYILLLFGLLIIGGTSPRDCSNAKYCS